MYATVGHDTETGHVVTIGDMERCGGLYVLGQPRTGKSTLLISLALSDIEKGYGILFIDPHTDAISDLVARIPSSRQEDVILLDPTNKTSSFGINLLHCADPTDPLELDKTYGRVRDIFVKVWGDQNGQLGVWLEKILRNSVYLLLENPGYTLVELPLLLGEDTRFRNSLLENVRVNPYVNDFWYYEFDRLSRRDKTDQVGPVLSRLDIFRTNTMIRHIVGQRQSTVDFYEILNGANSQRIVLLRMPTQLSSDVKILIGTILLSEIVNAVFDRDQLPERERRFFSLFCDEFHDFATPDFAKLFTQTGKYRVMPAVAHHERLGQFKQGDPNQGATLAAPNKVLFTLSVHDAGELALEFAKAPPTEIRTEPKLVISQEPVLDLLRGHDNPQIREFVDRYLRPLQEQFQDARDDMEGERLIRTDYLDEAALHRINERVDWLEQRGRGSEEILGRAQRSLQLARGQTSRMYSLFETVKNVRQSMREINRLFTALMEGRANCGGEDFSQFLIERVRGSALVPESLVKVLELYICLVYGSPNVPRIIPASLATRYGVWQEEEIKRLIEDKYLRERLRTYKDSDNRSEAREQGQLIREREAVLREMKTWRTWTGGADSLAKYSLETFLLFYYYRPLRELLTPYLLKRFRAPWERVYPRDTCSFWVNERYTKGAFVDEAISLFIKELRPSYMSVKVKESCLEKVAEFLRRFGEGAVVAVALISAGLQLRTIYASVPRESRTYKTLHMLELPAIEGHEPLEIILLLKELNDVLRVNEARFGVDFAWAYECDRNEYAEKGLRERIAGNFGIWSKRLEPGLLYEYEPKYGEEHGEAREDVVLLMEEVEEKQAQWFDREMCALWDSLDEFTRTYLIIRACDIVRFGEGVAKFTYPQPTIAGRTSEQVGRMVGVLVTLLEQAEEAKKRAKEEKRRKDVEESVRGELVTLDREEVTELLPRRLTGDEMQRLKAACWNQLSGCEPAYEMMRVIEKFVEFCKLLARPENHIKVPSRRYVEREVNTRQEADMTNEMARVFTGLAKYTAYAKIVRETEGIQSVWKGKIQTLKLTPLPEGEMAGEANKIRRAVIELKSMRYLKRRTEIEEEIRQRQEQWRHTVSDEPLRRQSEVGNGRTRPSAPSAIESEEPPSIHS